MAHCSSPTILTKQHLTRLEGGTLLFEHRGGSEKSLCVRGCYSVSSEAGVLGDSLGAFQRGVLGQFPRQQQAHGHLHLAGCDGPALVVMRQAGSLAGNALNDVVE